MRPEKATIVQDLQERLNSSPFLILIDYTGLTVTQFTELRNRLADNGARATVVRNTLLKKAAAELGIPDLDAGLNGQTAMVVGDRDISVVAKLIKTFKAEFQKPSLKLGVLDKALLSKEQVEAIAELPARDVLLATLLGVLQAPASKLVRTLNEPGASLARLLNAKAAKDAENAPAAEAPAEEAPAAEAPTAVETPAVEASAPAAAAETPAEAPAAASEETPAA